MANDPFSKLGALDQRLYQSGKPQSETHNDNSPTDSPVADTPTQQHKETQGEPTPNSNRQVRSKLVNKEVSKFTSKFTSKLVTTAQDPAVNKVGYYLTRHEMNKLDTLVLSIKQVLWEQYDVKVTKNDVVRACLVMGLKDWEENQLASEIARLLTSK